MEYLRPKDVLKVMKISRAYLYGRIRQGLFPRPKKLSPALAVWLDLEVKTVMDAMFRGKSEAEIRELVRQIEEARTQ